MFVVVHAYDGPSMSHVRAAHYGAHKAHLDLGQVHVIVSGPLQNEDGTQIVGSFFLFEADDVDTVKAHVAADPFALNGVWSSVRIDRFNKVRDNC